MPPDDGLAAEDPSTVVLPILRERHQIEVFAASTGQAVVWRDWIVPVREAHDFVWRHQAAPFDLVIYHLSNQPDHDYVWAYLWNYPGLVILHDTRLHHARARVLLERGTPRLHDYASELQFNHGLAPDVHQALGLMTGPTLGLWPMRGAVIRAARAVAVHTHGLVHDLSAEFPGIAFETIRLGVRDPGTHGDLRAASGSTHVRRRHGISGDAIVLAVFGPLTRSQRLPQILGAFAAVHQVEPRVHLLLAGAVQDEYDVASDLSMKRITDHVTVTGALRESELPEYMGAADIGLCLSWPTDGGLSPTWLRCLASGLPTVVTELEIQAHMPLLEPRNWDVRRRRGAATGRDPIAVSIGLRREQQALRSTFEQLAHNRRLRDRIGRAARTWWSVHHTPEVMANDYELVIARAAARPAPSTSVPAHLRPQVLEHTRALLSSIGVELPPEMESR